MEHVILNEETGAKISIYYHESKQMLPVVVICPGGGYLWLSDREQRPVAEAFLKQGFQAAVMEYNVQGQNLMYGPMLDLAWGVSQVRAMAEEFYVDPNKICVCGFSAGGHVAGMLGVSWSNPKFFSEKKEQDACRPNGLILCYPVVSAGEYAHRGSFERLSDDTSLWDNFSVEKLVNASVPPMFLWHTMEDRDVPVQNSLLLAQSMMNQGISSEIHIFHKGVHGLSLATKEVEESDKGRYADSHVAHWLDLCGEWIRDKV